MTTETGLTALALAAAFSTALMAGGSASAKPVQDFRVEPATLNHCTLSLVAVSFFSTRMTHANRRHRLA